MRVEDKRRYNIDLLRCVSMLLIVLGHYYGNVASNAKFDMNSLSYMLHYLIASMEGIGVNIFVLISGYFLIESQFSVEKVFKLWVQIFMYSVGIYLVLSITGLHNFSAKEFISFCLPIFGRKYWFATEYIRLYLVFPFLNILLKHLSRNYYKALLALLIFMNSIFPTLMDMDNRLKYLGNWSLWFITLYAISGYIRLYDIKWKKKTCLFAWIICTLMMFLSKVTIDNVTFHFFGTVIGTDLLSHNNSLFMLGAAVSVFMIFAYMKIEDGIGAKIIQIIAPGTFGIYLFHEHPILKPIMYGAIHSGLKWINIDSYGTNWVVVGIPAILAIYLLGCLIEKLRTVFWGMAVQNRKAYHEVFHKIEARLESFMNK